MNFNFELILFYIVVLSGVIGLVDILFWAKKRKLTRKKMPIIIEYARSFFPVLLVVFVVRSFLYEPFRIPSGSLEPTLLIGDFILVNKFDYGIRLPVLHQKVFKIGEPKRGDIFVFYWPPNPKYYLIKRVIGLPGDRISYVNKVVYVNGHEATQEFEQNVTYAGEMDMTFDVVQKHEDLLGFKHEIYQIPAREHFDFHDLIVPAGMYFGMGDNRDDSADSRFFGFIPDENIVGKADITWMSWDSEHHTVRWDRIFKRIH